MIEDIPLRCSPLIFHKSITRVEPKIYLDGIRFVKVKQYRNH